MKKILAVLLAVGIGAAANAQSPAQKAAEPQSFKAGKTTISIPTPVSDMVEVGADARSQLEGVFVPPTNRLLAVFVPARDIPLLTGGSPARMTRYAMVQIPRQGEYGDVDASDFARIVDEIKSDFGSPNATAAFQAAGDEVNRRLKSINVNASVALGEPVPLGPFFAKDDAYGFGMISPVSVGQQTVNVAMGGGVLRLKKKVVFVYLYTEYKQEETASWLRNATEQWAKALLALNK